MASPSSPQHEPTMEEILASIRKIISEDSTESQPAAHAAAQAAPQESDVLELTQEIQEVAAPVAQAAPPAPTPVPTPRPQDDVVFQTVEEPPVRAQTSASGFVSDKGRQALNDALSALDLPPAPVVSRQVPAPLAPAQLPVDGSSIAAVYEKAVREAFDPVLRSWLNDQADIVVEKLKPAIREWMDENLPAMMKSVVEAEVAKAVAARGKR